MTLYPSALIKTPTPFAGTARRKATPHPLIRPSTKFLWDCRLPACHPSGAIVPGALANGAALHTLAWPSSVGSIFGPDAVTNNTTWSINADGSLALPGNTASQISVGSAGQFDMAPAEYEYIFELWYKPPASGYVTTAYTPLAKLTASDANHAQVWIDMGNDGLKPRAAIGFGTGSASSGYTADQTLGTLRHFAAHYNPTAHQLDFYDNNVLVQSISGGAIPTDLQSASAAFFAIMGGQKGSIYGFALHDQAASYTAEQGFADGIAGLTVSQHVDASYKFGTGALSSAPSTGFGS